MTHKRFLPLLAYIVLAAGVFSANLIAFNASRDTDRRQVVEQRAGCERTNDLRNQINMQSEAFLHHNRITYSLFQDVGKTLPEGSVVRIRVDNAVQEYQHLERSYSPLPLINCQQAYKSDQ